MTFVAFAYRYHTHTGSHLSLLKGLLNKEVGGEGIKEGFHLFI